MLRTIIIVLVICFLVYILAIQLEITKKIFKIHIELLQEFYILRF